MSAYLLFLPLMETETDCFESSCDPYAVPVPPSRIIAAIRITLLLPSFTENSFSFLCDEKRLLLLGDYIEYLKCCQPSHLEDEKPSAYPSLCKTKQKGRDISTTYLMRRRKLVERFYISTESDKPLHVTTAHSVSSCGKVFCVFGCN